MASYLTNSATGTWRPVVGLIVVFTGLVVAVAGHLVIGATHRDRSRTATVMVLALIAMIGSLISAAQAHDGTLSNSIAGISVLSVGLYLMWLGLGKQQTAIQPPAVPSQRKRDEQIEDRLAWWQVNLSTCHPLIKIPVETAMWVTLPPTFLLAPISLGELLGHFFGPHDPRHWMLISGIWAVSAVTFNLLTNCFNYYGEDDSEWPDFEPIQLR